jgi:predicted acyltransferase
MQTADPLRAPRAAAVKSPRILSLDVLRGLTIAGMILVNNPGNYEAAYPPLTHAAWNGWHAADFVFPFFLFIVGVAIPLSSRLVEGGRGRIVRRILRRSAVLLLIGVFLSAFPVFDLAALRVPGVLQRIALCYAFAAILFASTSVSIQGAVTLSLLVVYWLLLRFVPVPGFGAGILEPDANLAAYLDRLVLGEHHLYRRTWDPEGLLSTLPAAATTLLGVLAGHWLRSSRASAEKAAGLVVMGATGLVLGEALGRIMPINKNLWTSSFVVLSGGVASLFLGVCYWIVDVRRIRRPFLPLVVFGVNSIAVYVASSLATALLGTVKVDSGRQVLRLWIYRHLFGHHLSPELGSLLYALGYVTLWLAPMGVLYKKKIYIRI